MGLNFEYTIGQTPLDEDEKSGLIISSISTREELDEFEQLNIEKAMQWYFRRNLTIEQLFSERFTKELHKKMFGEVWKWAGKFRTSEKNIGIKSYLIPIELKMLFDDVKFWIQNEIYEPEEIAIRCKHRLVSIHCFSNGNGRHSRLMADLIMQKIFHQQFFTWGSKRLEKVSAVRSNYIKALQSADLHDITLLIEFAKS